jgi:hypothetical protein
MLCFTVQGLCISVLSSAVTHANTFAVLIPVSRTVKVLEEISLEVFQYPLYSPQLLSSDFHLFGLLMESLEGQKF